MTNKKVLKLAVLGAALVCLLVCAAVVMDKTEISSAAFAVA